jgi:WD40 repeat protein
METQFKTIQEASGRWKREGRAYKDQINDWLDIIYIDKKDPEQPWPEETRQDMAAYVLGQIEAYNERGEYEALRELFPPDNDPFNWEGLTECVSQVSILADNRLVVTVGAWHDERRVYLITGNTFALQEGIILFGKSHDKKHFAKVYADKIDISEGWDGPVINTFTPPRTYGEGYVSSAKDGLSEINFEEFGMQQVVVFPDGQQVALASDKGIFVIDKKDAHFIETEEKEEEEAYEEGYTLGHDYPHVDVSPDGKYIIAGSQSSNHLLFELVNGEWTVIATVEPRSSYPNFAMFNYKISDAGQKNDGPQVLLCSCHFSQSAAVALPIKNVTPGFSASGYNADEALNYVDDNRWVMSAAPADWGYSLGCNDGYIWFKGQSGMHAGYLHIGGSVMDIDVSADWKSMAVASYSGQVIVWQCTSVFNGNQLFRHQGNREERRRDDLAITNTAFEDVKRYLFLDGREPMVW